MVDEPVTDRPGYLVLFGGGRFYQQTTLELIEGLSDSLLRETGDLGQDL
jgi:hypothetical protein